MCASIRARRSPRVSTRHLPGIQRRRGHRLARHGGPGLRRLRADRATHGRDATHCPCGPRRREPCARDGDACAFATRRHIRLRPRPAGSRAWASGASRDPAVRQRRAPRATTPPVLQRRSCPSLAAAACGPGRLHHVGAVLVRRPALEVAVSGSARSCRTSADRPPVKRDVRPRRTTATTQSSTGRLRR